MELTCNSDEKCHSTRITYITLPRYYLVCFAAVFLKLRSHSSLPRCYKFSPAVDARWEHAAKTRFCRNLMGPYFQAVLYLTLVDTNQIHPVQQKLRVVHYQVLTRTLLTGDAKLIKRNHVTHEACNKT